MIVTEPGKVTERITLLGRTESCIYHVDGGEEAVLVGGGMSYIVPDVLEQLEKFEIDEQKIQRLIILHSHFDHCGIIPYFKKRWPRAVVTASNRAKTLLADPKVTETIAVLNGEATIRARLKHKADELGLQFTGIEVEETIGEGDVISCGDLKLEVIDVPGHSSCSIALYMPREKALFASDAAGIRYKDFILAAGNSNFDLYQKSLEKMAGYDVNVVMGEHYGASLGEHARDFFLKSMASARATRTQLEESYRRIRDVEKCTEEVTDALLSQAPGHFFPREVLSLVTGQMVKYIAKTIQEQERK